MPLKGRPLRGQVLVVGELGAYIVSTGERGKRKCAGCLFCYWLFPGLLPGWRNPQAKRRAILTTTCCRQVGRRTGAHRKATHAVQNDVTPGAAKAGACRGIGRYMKRVGQVSAARNFATHRNRQQPRWPISWVQAGWYGISGKSTADIQARPRGVIFPRRVRPMPRSGGPQCFVGCRGSARPPALSNKLFWLKMKHLPQI